MAPPRFLFLMRLPPDPRQWLRWREARLVAKRCVYWVGLGGAGDLPAGQATRTVYVPKRNVLSPDALRALLAEVSRGETPAYEEPAPVPPQEGPVIDDA